MRIATLFLLCITACMSIAFAAQRPIDMLTEDELRTLVNETIRRKNMLLQKLIMTQFSRNLKNSLKARNQIPREELAALISKIPTNYQRHVPQKVNDLIVPMH